MPPQLVSTHRSLSKTASSVPQCTSSRAMMKVSGEAVIRVISQSHYIHIPIRVPLLIMI